MLKRINEEEGTTIFVSSHILSEIEKFCTHLGIINNGEMVFQGAVEEFRSSNKTDIQIEIETSDLMRTNDLVRNMTLQTPIFINYHLLISLKEKKDITVLIDKLRAHDIDVFELKFKYDLEKFFLDQTRNSL